MKWNEFTFGVVVLAFGIAIWYWMSRRPVRDYDEYADNPPGGLVLE